jgi:hypothetical protein
MTSSRFDRFRNENSAGGPGLSAEECDEILDAIADLAAKVYVPGLWKCPKCKFQLTTSVLYAKTGNIGVQHHNSDPCPNDGETLLPVTWEEDAREMSERMMQAILMDRIDELRKNEGASVRILCDNPDGPPNFAIEVNDEWTGWNDRRFEGERLIECLNDAIFARGK